MRYVKKENKRSGRKSLQSAMLVLMAILLLFFCAMFSVFTYIIAKNAEDDFKVRTSETAVNNAAATIKASVVNYNCLTRLLMVNERIVNFLKAENPDNDITYEARRGIYEIQNLYSYIDSVYIFRNDGGYVSTERAEYVIDMESAEHQRILDAIGSTVVSVNGNGMIKKHVDEQLLTMSRAIYDINSQKLIGMLIMNISSDYFEEILDAQSAEKMCILDRNGIVLCGNEEIGKLYEDCYDSENIVFNRVKLNGKKTIVAGTMAVDPIIVLCVESKSSDTIPQNAILALLIPMSAFFIAILVCVWFITVNIARPIRKLSEAMEHTKSSGWLEKIDAEMPNNELGRLADSYNTMIEYLNELFNRLLENEKNMQKAEMRVLQEQIKPHFLYNTLDTISYLAFQENTVQVQNALETLGSFYRNFLNNGEREIPLRRELRITQDYLSLQKLRYDDIFEDEYIIDENTLDCMIPKLILQPLVENSIYHGIRLKGEKGIIRITTRMSEEGVHIVVYDTGVGMTKEQIDDIVKTQKENGGRERPGFGLRGTINRIRYYCDCENVVQIRSEPGEYTEVEIFVPIMLRVKSMEGSNV